MKDKLKLRWSRILALLVGVLVITQVNAQEKKDEYDAIYLVDLDYEEYMQKLEGAEASGELDPFQVQDMDEMDKLFADEAEPLNRRQARVAERTRLQQARLIQLLDEMLTEDFDPEDDLAYPRFSAIRNEIVKLVFFAETERSFYQRLYLLNQSWLENLDQVDRFNSLDHALRDRMLELDEKRRRIRELIIGATTLIGTIGGGYLSYQVSKKIVPVAANESTFRLITKWVGRGTFIVIGSYVGMSLGSYVGFLGSDALLYKHYEYVDPIDGNEDLREILDVIDSL